MDQLSTQSYRSSDKPQPDEILGDLLTALEHMMLTRGKVVTPLLLAAVQHRVHVIQQRARRQVRR